MQGGLPERADQELPIQPHRHRSVPERVSQGSDSGPLLLALLKLELIDVFIFRHLLVPVGILFGGLNDVQSDIPCGICGERTR